MAYKKPNWKNTIHNLNSTQKYSIRDLAGFCVSVGYSFILWNDRVYAVNKDVEWVDTGLTIVDMP